MNNFINRKYGAISTLIINTKIILTLIINIILILILIMGIIIYCLKPKTGTKYIVILFPIKTLEILIICYLKCKIIPIPTIYCLKYKIQINLVNLFRKSI